MRTEAGLRSLVIDCRFVHHSGIGRYMRALVPRVLRQLPGIEATLLVQRSEYDAAFVAQCRAAGARLLPVEAGMYSLAEQWRVPLAVPRCDVFWMMHYDVPLLPVRARRRLVTIHDMAHLAVPDGMGLAKRAYARLFYWRAAQSDAILTVSEFSRREILAYERVRPERVHVVCNGVEDSLRPCGDARQIAAARDRYGIPPRYLLFVGNLKPNKNLPRLLAAFARAKRQTPQLADTALAVVGRRSGLRTGEGDLDDLLRVLGLVCGRDVVLAGEVVDAELRALYTGALAFVFPSLYEGFGLPPLEAMACGCPVLAARAASLPEVCGDAALYFFPRAPEEMAAALSRIAAEPRLRSELRASGLRHAKRFSWDAAAGEIAALLCSLAV